jgi:tetratricopeptide (TPR) repeat protein
LLLTVALPLTAAQGPAKAAKAASPLDSLEHHYQAARTFSVGGNPDRAAVEYRAFLGEAMRQMANARVNAGNSASALPLFEEAIALDPESAELHLDCASALLRRGDADRAQIEAQKAVDLGRGNSKAQALLGRVLYEQGDYKQAKEHLEAAVKATQSDVSFQIGYDLARTYLKLDDVNRASVVFDEMMIGLGDTSRLHIYFGHAYLMSGQYDRAVTEFKRALQKDPKAKEAHYFLGLSYLSRDEGNGFEENAAEDRAEIQINPGDFRPHHDLGNIAMHLHHVDEAERELKRASEIEPGNPDPLITLGELYVSQRRLPEAEAAMTRAISLTKDVTRNGYQVNRAYYVLGRVQVETGRREEGSQNLKRAVELREKTQLPTDRDTTSAAARQRLASEQPIRGEDEVSSIPPDQQRQLDAYFERLKPAIADSYNNLGVAAASHKDFAGAINYFRRAGQWYPELETLDRNLGMAAFYSGAYPDAVQPLWHALQRSPDDERVRAALGLSYFSIGNYEGTVETLQPIEQTVIVDPGAGSAYGVALIKTGKYEQGIARLKALEQANPDAAGVHAAVGEAYADQGVYASAVDEYKKALELDSGQQRVHFLLGVALLRNGKPADAVPELRTALKASPADATVKYHLGTALVQSEQREEALLLFQQVIAQNPKYADAYYQLGKLQLEGGDAKQAISNLESAVGLSPSSDYIHYQLSLAYGRDLRTDDAQREMQLYQALKTQRRGDHEQSRAN